MHVNCSMCVVLAELGRYLLYLYNKQSPSEIWDLVFHVDGETTFLEAVEEGAGRRGAQRVGLAQAGDDSMKRFRL
jgi:hypothetical protein